MKETEAVLKVASGKLAALKSDHAFSIDYVRTPYNHPGAKQRTVGAAKYHRIHHEIVGGLIAPQERAGAYLKADRDRLIGNVARYTAFQEELAAIQSTKNSSPMNLASARSLS
ncbi:hypothetical protein [Burkholderia ambifaria]|uniref:hypothetical protein n=1 Tax=Burkholderia ambifaria TaxID=152480 RepID=UPI00159239DD|nr:hypothetical protein [Burkholderia ambifaria]